jgi:tRNA threonylcarbamoyladenosine biosynthesis protein TsaB
MRILGIDTSTGCGSVGLIDGDETLCEHLPNVPVTHSERLLSSIEYVLKASGCSVRDLDGWAISLGPGSFTGLRIGVSTIKGLAFATQKPVAGVPTLDALASQISSTPYLICPILDARKGELYASFYRYEEGEVLKRISDYQAVGPELLAKKIERKTIFIGSGVKTSGDYLRNTLPSFSVLAPDPLNLLRGSTVARLGLELLRREEYLNLTSFAPIYVRPSEAEIKWQEKHPDFSPPLET